MAQVIFFFYILLLVLPGKAWKILLNFHLQQQKDAMKWIYYLVIYAIVDFPIYFSDWKGSKNVFSRSVIDNKACGLRATKSL